jgi:hypothetical protein
MTSPIYGFPELTPTTVERTNTNLVVRYIESLVGAVPTVNVSVVPTAPTDGSVYLINGVPSSGIWSGKAGQVGIYTISGWFYVPTHPKYLYSSGIWVSSVSGGGGTPVSSVSAGSLSATPNTNSISLAEIVAPSGFTWTPLVRSFYRGNSAQFPLSSGTLLSGNSLPLNDTGLASGTYYYRMIVADQAGIKAYTAEVSATATSAAFDVDTIAGINAVEATGVTLTGAQKTAANNAIVAYKNPTNGTIWTKLRGLYLFLGGTADAHAVNWRSPGTLTATANGLGLVHDASGIKGGGTGYMQIPFNPPASESSSNALAIYVSQTSINGQTNVCLTALSPGFLGIKNEALGSAIFNYSNVSPSDPLLNGVGSLLFSKNSASSGKSYKNGQFKADVIINFSGNPDINPIVTLLARGNYPGADQFTDAKIASFALFNSSLTDTEASAYTEKDLAYQTALGRQ